MTSLGRPLGLLVPQHARQEPPGPTGAPARGADCRRFGRRMCERGLDLVERARRERAVPWTP